MKVKEIDISLMFLLIFFFLFGVVMVYSASAYYTYKSLGQNPHYFALNQLIYGILGIIVMLIVSSIDLEIIRRNIGKLIILTIILLIMVEVPGIGKKVGGSNRWINLRLFNFQPSELAKITVIFFMANFLDKNKFELDSFFDIVVPTSIIVGGIIVLIILEPDFSTGAIIFLLWLGMLIVSGFRWTYIALIILICVLIGAGFILQKDYRIRRVKAWWYENSDPLDEGYHISRSKLAIITGGIFGKGLGNSEVKIAGLPEAHTDFIFSIICEEIGFIPVTVIIILYCVLLFRGFRLVYYSDHTFYKFLAFGITMLFAIHIFVNIGVVIDFFPTTGITLPFISYGGTSLIIFMAAIGILLNISAKTQN